MGHLLGCRFYLSGLALAAILVASPVSAADLPGSIRQLEQLATTRGPETATT